MWRRVNRTLVTVKSKMILLGPFTGSNDNQSNRTLCEFLAHPQKWRIIETHDGIEVEIDEQLQYFALRLQKSAFDFYRNLTNAPKTSYDETVRAFRTHYNEKSIVFRGRPARKASTTEGTLFEFFDDLQCLAMKAYPEELNEIRAFLIVHDFLENIHNSQDSVALRENHADAELTSETVLEKAVHLDAVTRFMEEGRVAALQPENR